MDFQAHMLQEAVLAPAWLIVALLGLLSAVLKLCLLMCLQLPQKELTYDQNMREGGNAESQSRTGSWGLSGWSLG